MLTDLPKNSKSGKTVNKSAAPAHARTPECAFNWLPPPPPAAHKKRRHSTVPVECPHFISCLAARRSPAPADLLSSPPGRRLLSMLVAQRECLSSEPCLHAACLRSAAAAPIAASSRQPPAAAAAAQARLTSAFCYKPQYLRQLLRIPSAVQSTEAC